MQATSGSQYDSTVKGTVPDLERVRDGVWVLPTPTPLGTVPYTLTYLIRDTAGGVHVIDPGWNSVDNWGLLAFTLTRIGHSMSDVASTVLTHMHPDHTGMAERLRTSTGASIVLHRAEQLAIVELAQAGVPTCDLDRWGVPADRRKELLDVEAVADRIPLVTADVLVDDGDTLDIPGRELTVLHTPGHTVGSMTLRQADESLVYTGDTLLPAVYPGLGLGGSSTVNPIAAYLASIERLSALDDHEVCPGHGYRFTGLAQRVGRTALHHKRRTDEVERAVNSRPSSTVWEIASQLTWTAGWGNLHGFYLQSALSTTAMHLELVRAP